MLIRIKGYASGFKDYFESGLKEGRDESRDELDQRIVLDGDIDLTHEAIESLGPRKERYLSIVMSLREDHVDEEILRSIAIDVKEFALAASSDGEFLYYAEAHIPRAKYELDRQSGELKPRKPHIHAIIPEINTLTGKYMNPLGRVDQQTKFLEALQEHINIKYGLESPKDHQRTAIVGKADLIGRHRDDLFKGDKGKELKLRLLSEVMNRGITDYQQFKKLVSEYGEIEIGNKRQPEELQYLKVIPPGASKATRLDHPHFSREFIELPIQAKRERLASPDGYEAVQRPKQSAEVYAARLKEWHEVRSKEVKYINSGNRKFFSIYKAADPEQRRAILAERAKKFYEKHRIEQPDTELQAPARTRQDLTPKREAQQVTRDQPTRREVDNVVGQKLFELGESKARARGNEQSEITIIKRELDARRLLSMLSHSHRVIPGDYTITKGKDGSDRIGRGNRNFNVSDFLTKEMHLPWTEAEKVLRECHANQRDRVQVQQRSAPRRELWQQFRTEWKPAQVKSRRSEWDQQRVSETERGLTIKNEFLAKRGAIKADRASSPAQRKANASIARMARIEAEQHLRERIKEERAALKGKHQKPSDELYRDFLTEKAKAGDVPALAELRRQRKREPAPQGPRIESADSEKRQEQNTIMQSTAYSVDGAGNVTYYDSQKQAMFRDSGRAVEFAKTDTESIEKGLRLAAMKFGQSVQLNGTAEQKRQMVDVAADAGLRLDFNDKELNARYQQRIEATKAGRELFARAAVELQAKHAPAAEAKETPEKEQQKKPDEPKRDRGYER